MTEDLETNRSPPIVPINIPAESSKKSRRTYLAIRCFTQALFSKRTASRTIEFADCIVESRDIARHAVPRKSWVLDWRCARVTGSRDRQGRLTFLLFDR